MPSTTKIAEFWNPGQEWSVRPTDTGGAVFHSTRLMLSYHAVAFPGSEAKSATVWRDRPMSTVVTTSTAIQRG